MLSVSPWHLGQFHHSASGCVPFRFKLSLILGLCFACHVQPKSNMVGILDFPSPNVYPLHYQTTLPTAYQKSHLH